jgi:uncharacterized membrane protein
MKLSKTARFCIYGMNGIATEVLYTALWDFIEKKNLKTVGVSSFWAFIIYGLSTLFIEYLKPILVNYKLKLPFRAFIYMIWIFSWEFSTGFLLRVTFDACPWDYSEYFNWNVMGLITLEYAPLWYFASMFSEQYVIRLTNKLRWNETSQEHKD